MNRRKTAIEEGKSENRAQYTEIKSLGVEISSRMRSFDAKVEERSAASGDFVLLCGDLSKVCGD